MSTTPNFHPSATMDHIQAYEVLYQQALSNDEQFHVLKDIREAIKKLRKTVESKQTLSVERVLTAK